MKILAVIAMGFMFWRYHVLARDFAKLAGEYALEIHHNLVLADRAEKAEKKLKWVDAQLDEVLLVPQSRCSDGARIRPTVAVIRDEGQA